MRSITTMVTAVLVLALAISTSGCAATRAPWGKASVVGGFAGAFFGGLAAGIAANDGAFDTPDDETRGVAIVCRHRWVSRRRRIGTATNAVGRARIMNVVFRVERLVTDPGIGLGLRRR